MTDATPRRKLRNIAIIAHVDHGKTTLVDKLLRQAGTFAAHQHVAERVMDSNDLERERGITILAKNCAIEYGGTHINIVDTPGHADFGGEVERVLSMVDGVLLLVDAVEGPMPQTRFVTRKALALGLKPIVVVNKVDRPGARAEWVVNQTFDLFDQLGASEEQLDFPVVYASALHGYASLDLKTHGHRHAAAVRDDPRAACPRPPAIPTRRCSCRSARSTTRATSAGSASAASAAAGSCPGQEVMVLLGRRRGGARQGRPGARLRRAGARAGRKRRAGDIVLITGIDELSIGTTIAAVDAPEALPMLAVDEPTLTMNFQVNTSPLAGKEGKFVTSRKLRERLSRELLTNVALRVEDTADADVFPVFGRGELHLTILLENMRREGYELAVSRPRVVFREIDGEQCEPYEQLTVDVEDAHQGAVMEALGERRGELTHMESDGRGRMRLEYRIPARGLIGFQGEFLNLTRGTGLISHVFDDYAPVKRRHAGAAQRRADLGGRRRGGRLRAVEAAGARAHVRLARRQAVRRHGHRHPQPRQRPGRQSDQGQAADQHPRLRQGRSDRADAADPADAGIRGRVHRRRRAGRDHAEVDPHPQALPAGARAQARKPRSGVEQNRQSRAVTRFAVIGAPT